MRNKLRFSIGLLLFMILAGASVYGQTQSQSIRTDVTFNWEDAQDANNDGNVDDNENNLPATIETLEISGTLYNSFIIPSSYQLTRLGAEGHGPNRFTENGVNVIIGSNSATLDLTDSNPWDDAAIDAFRDRNLNHYFNANPNGRDFCGDFGWLH